MTLVLAWNMVEGVAVAADTMFGSNFQTVAMAGPKIFSVPIVLNRWGDRIATEKTYLPNMGFAFAGNSFAGQTAHGLATTCLQNLVSLVENDTGPTVEEVANLYARCAALVVNERRQWLRTDAHLFEGLVFGRSTPEASAQAFTFEVRIDDNALAMCTAEEVDFTRIAVMVLGSGTEAVREIVESARGTGTILNALDVLRQVMDDPEVPSVGGYQQYAVAAVGGVEIRPSLSVVPLASALVV
ncbi:Ntn hydrolase family protein [Sphingopyxis macrogoltabida]|uniref:Uncharacterized protein n=1 Tax=Sphingopyxis macrogoltabida TaxID=33050 RepID=A0AAC9AX42_SPHMC|nr:hypothetical protein [Sphingopyxis macrogoltabida]ALJ15294.1 hypothetical protein LH19_20660 [Sphingopyxis macrogoltabida]AMU91537.1 hypothetical protein ATM17_21195 [Sphingopyxis macrogoltabida]